MIDVWVFWILIVGLHGEPEWHAMGASRDRATCMAEVQKFLKIPSYVGSRLITATCKQAKA